MSATGGAAQAWFVAGTVPFIVAGGLHAVAALVDTARPTFFTPIDDAARVAVDGTSIRLRRLFGGSGRRPSMWRVWLGINVSHGLAIAAFNLLCLLLAVHDFRLVGEIPALRPLTVAFAGSYLLLSLRYWFYGPTLITGISTLCYTVSAVLSA